MTTEKPCSTHPDAPHGFNRNGSHSVGYYVCECSGWTPPEPRSLQERLQELADNSLIDYHTPDSRNRILVQEAADKIDALEAEIESLQLRNQELAADAGRYQWLRDSESLSSPSVDLAKAFERYSGSFLDGHIDAEIGKEAK